MQQEIWQSNQAVTTNDLARAQSTKEGAIVERLTDTFNYGIILGSQFLSETLPFLITNVGGVISIGTGVAYDKNGERIVLPATNWPIAYSLSNVTYTSDNGIGGTTITPQSTGSGTITPPISALVSPQANFYYISYLKVTDPTVFTLQKVTNERLFVSGTDGYRIDVVVGNITDTPGSHAPTPEALFLGTVSYAGVVSMAGRTTFSLNETSLQATIPNQANSLRAQDVAASRPDTYTVGNSVNFVQHVEAVGTGILTDLNPHGLSINDISGVLSTKTVEQHEELFHDAGISGNQNSTTSGLYCNIQTSQPAGSPAYGKDDFLIKKLTSFGSQNFEGTGAQVIYTLTGGLTYTVGNGSLSVFVNGVVQTLTSDPTPSTYAYAETSNTSITFATAPPAEAAVVLEIAGEAVQVNGVTISAEGPTWINQDYIFYFLLGGVGTPLDNGYYTIYLDSDAGALRLAYGGPSAPTRPAPSQNYYVVYGTANLVSLSLPVTSYASVTSNLRNMILWQVSWNSTSGSSTVKDLRLFGTVGNNSLQRDSYSDTVTINHNVTINGNGSNANGADGLVVNGNLTATGTISMPNFIAVPIGSVIAFAGSTAPAGWFACDGTSYSRAQYPLLNAALLDPTSTQPAWGYIDPTHFNVPDLQGTFLRGWNHSASDAATFGDLDAATLRSPARHTNGVTGDKVGSYEADQVISHTHFTSAGSGQDFQTNNVTGILAANAQTGSYGGSETRGRNAFVMYIIKHD